MASESRTPSHLRPVFDVVFAPVLMANSRQSMDLELLFGAGVAAGRVAVLSGATPAWCGIRRHQPAHAPAVAWRVAPDRTSMNRTRTAHRSGTGRSAGSVPGATTN
jgi:hypothetical protein